MSDHSNDHSHSPSAHGDSHAADVHPHEGHGAAESKPLSGRSSGRPLRRAIVVGASSGIGAELVADLVRRGYAVGVLARRAEPLHALEAAHPGRIHVRVHDVNDASDVQPAFMQLVEALGGLDMLVYAAGIMPAVGPEEYDTQKDLAQIATNLSGAIAWCNEAARLFQTQRSGTLVGIGSVAGDRGRKQNPAYHATKAGFATYLESMRNRLSEFGVHVLTVKPGPVDTPMTSGISGLPFLIPADRAARTIGGAAERRFWNTRYVPLRWWPIMSVLRAIPSRVFRHMNV